MKEDDIRRALITKDGLYDMINEGIGNGSIRLPEGGEIGGVTVPVSSGGNNLIPNSDFNYSYKASTEAGVDPLDADPTNKKLYKVFKQAFGANIGTEVTDTEADGITPIWNRTLGVVQLGAADEADNMDIAIQMSSNILQFRDIWYLQAALALIDATLLPDGSIFYMGFWVKKIGGAEGWVEGGSINLTAHREGVAGTTLTEYLLITKLASGYTVSSNVISLADAPDILDATHRVLLEFVGTAGFIELKLYRKRAGQVFLIASIVNDTQIHHYDEGDNIGVDLVTFPVVDSTALRAYAEVFPSAQNIAVSKTFTRPIVRIPDFDITQVTAGGTFLRMGLKTETAIDRQICIDTIWAALSLNAWSPAVEDNPFGNAPSVDTVTTV